ncbi:TPA: hypothetical protein SLO96_003011 [Proteus mirabilis]|nr:hypothetical protein [Proteus mirabilis]
MKIKTLIDIITSDLGDNESGYENTTWSRAQIRDWIVEGYNTVFDNRPDLFMEHKVIKVAHCSTLQDTCDCTKIRRVLGQANEKGRVFNPLRERGLEIGFQWTGKTCSRKSSGKFLLESYAIDKTSENLYVYPEVPPSEDVYIVVECSVRPTASTEEDDIKDDGYAAVIQWVLWRAKSMDVEVSPASQSAAQLHYRAFFDVLGITLDKQTVIHKRDNT